MEEFKNEGVYCLINEQNNRMYIGSSMNLGNRKTKHFSLLKHNKHQNHLLQADVNQFGIESFKFKILKYCKTQLKIEEQYFCDELRPYYNITKDVIRNTPSEKSRKKMSKTRLEMYKNGLKPNGAKPIIQKSIDGDFITEHNSIMEASRVTGIDRSAIQRVLYGKYKQMKGFIFHYKN